VWPEGYHRESNPRLSVGKDKFVSIHKKIDCKVYGEGLIWTPVVQDWAEGRDELL